MDMKPNGRRKPRKIPAVLTPEEQAHLLEAISTDTPAGMRNLLIIRTCLDAGLRASEVLALKVRDIDLKSGQLMVRNGKGGKDRSLWLGPDLVTLLGTFVETQGKVKGDAYLFTSRTGAALGTGYLRALVRGLAKKAGVEHRVHPHQLRHTFARDLLAQTKSIFLVSQALGHANVATTQIYLHLIPGELAGAMQGLRANGGGSDDRGRI